MDNFGAGALKYIVFLAVNKPGYLGILFIYPKQSYFDFFSIVY